MILTKGVSISFKSTIDHIHVSKLLTQKGYINGPCNMGVSWIDRSIDEAKKSKKVSPHEKICFDKMSDWMLCWADDGYL